MPPWDFVMQTPGFAMPSHDVVIPTRGVGVHAVLRCVSERVAAP